MQFEIGESTSPTLPPPLPPPTPPPQTRFEISESTFRPLPPPPSPSPHNTLEIINEGNMLTDPYWNPAVNLYRYLG